MNIVIKVTEIYCFADDFCTEFERQSKEKALFNPCGSSERLKTRCKKTEFYKRIS